jgi:DNA-binding transcriptional MocR family regulator
MSGASRFDCKQSIFLYDREVPPYWWTREVSHVTQNEAVMFNLTRGVPSQAQLDLSNGMLDYTMAKIGDIDCRSYGILEGIPAARTLCAAYLDTPYEDTWVLGNSSLALMYDLLAQIRLRGMCGYRTERPAIIVPVPAYDRHIAICELLGYEVLAVPLRDHGPDMFAIARYAENKRVVGIIIVPTYSNPTGYIYTKSQISQLIGVDAANPEFRLFADDAYRIHHLVARPTVVAPHMHACAVASSKEDRLVILGSTSKITFPGASIAMLAMSAKNRAWYRESLSVQTIGPDKLNQLRHALFLRDIDHMHAHMARHRAILVPKFAVVDEHLRAAFTGSKDVAWTQPKGGYFVSVTVPEGTASRIVASSRTHGVDMTPASAGFPTGKSPDNHIRIAPTALLLSGLGEAMSILVRNIQEHVPRR